MSVILKFSGQKHAANGMSQSALDKMIVGTDEKLRRIAILRDRVYPARRPYPMRDSRGVLKQIIGLCA
ncbi:MAG: hypothetical protein CL610_16415 [Anaerolineaceae bacterium]|nr:hypothetical protein [Anaerolineaceae bacterium]